MHFLSSKKAYSKTAFVSTPLGSLQRSSRSPDRIYVDLFAAFKGEGGQGIDKKREGERRGRRMTDKG